LSAGPGQVAKVLQHQAEFVVPVAHPDVVQPVGGLVDGQGLFEVLAGGRDGARAWLPAPPLRLRRTPGIPGACPSGEKRL
jgi:hypothetical protein